MIPKLRFQEFQDDFNSDKLGQLITSFSGGTPSASNKAYYDGDIPFIKSGEINDAKTEQFINEIALANSSAKIVNKGDLLLALYGATSGEIAISKLEGAINQAVLCIRSERLNLEYLKFWFELNKEKILRKYLQGGQGNLSASIVKSLIIRYPSRNEQIKTAVTLKTVDQKINLLTKKKEALETYKKGLMQKIFSQELRFKREDGTDYPEWENVKISEVAICKDNKRVPLNQSARNSKKGNIPYYGANGIVDYIDDYIFDEELVLLAEDGGFFFEFNTKPIAQLVKGKSWVNNHAHVLKARNGIILTDFLFYSLVHSDIRKWIIGGSRVKLNKSDLLNIKFYLPTIGEQMKINSVLSTAFKRINTLDIAIYRVKELKKGLLQQMFV